MSSEAVRAPEEARSRPRAGPRLPARRDGPRLFATPADEPRARRAGDVIALVTSGAVLLVVSLSAVPPPGFGEALVEYLNSFPGTLDGLWEVLSDLLVLLALLLLVGAGVRRRTSIVRDQLLAVALAALLWLVVGRIVVGSWPDAWDSLRSAEPPPWYPSPRVALPAALIMTTSPHLARPVRRLGRYVVFLAMVSVAMLGAATPLGAVGGFLVATMAAAAVHLVFGSSEGRPGLGLVRSALRELGVATRSLGAADRQQAGVFLVRAESDRGEHLVVKVYGRDAHDAALVSTAWRTIWYRNADDPVRLGRLQQVEHEAFLTLLARQHGVATDRVVTAGPTSEDDAVLVLHRSGRVLAEAVEAGEPVPSGDALVPAVWDLVGRLHGGNIAHGQVDAEHLLLPDGAVGTGGRDGPRRPGGPGPVGDRPVLGAVDFRGASVAARDELRRADEVQALVTTVVLAGQSAAVAGAAEALGHDGLAATLPYLQPSVLTPYLRRQVKERDLDLDDLRTDAAEAVGAEAPDLQQLRRITVRSLVNVVLPAVAVVALLSGLAGLDLSSLRDMLGQANWWLVGFGALFIQVPRLTQATSTLGAAPVPLPLGPVYALQLAISYVNLAIPTAAARMAVNIRFFQRHGVPPSGALAAGAIDGLTGFLVEAVLVGGLLMFTGASLDLNVGSAVDDATGILLVVAIIAVLAIGVVLGVARLRRFVAGWARRLRTDAVTAVRGLWSPRRLALLFGGNLGSELLFATSLGIFVRALGYSVGLDELLLINISVSLLSGLIPVPGGIGVTEAGLTYGLVQVGVPEDVALSAALLYRLTSFYVPPVWGYFAMRWLEDNDHL